MNALCATSSLVAVMASVFATNLVYGRKVSNRLGKPAIFRERRSVQEVYKALGSIYFCRAYQMSYKSFIILHGKLLSNIEKYSRNSNVAHTNLPPTANGRIDSTVRLACALRYFAGGSPYD